jgi:hypothetical protein
MKPLDNVSVSIKQLFQAMVLYSNIFQLLLHHFSWELPLASKVILDLF